MAEPIPGDLRRGTDVIDGGTGAVRGGRRATDPRTEAYVFSIDDYREFRETRTILTDHITASNARQITVTARLDGIDAQLKTLVAAQQTAGGYNSGLATVARVSWDVFKVAIGIIVGLMASRAHIV